MFKVITVKQTLNKLYKLHQKVRTHTIFKLEANDFD